MCHLCSNFAHYNYVVSDENNYNFVVPTVPGTSAIQSQSFAKKRSDFENIDLHRSHSASHEILIWFIQCPLFHSEPVLQNRNLSMFINTKL